VLYNEPNKLSCNKQFHLKFFYEDDVFNKEAVAFIHVNKIVVIPIELEEVDQVFRTEDFHYPEAKCSCCDEEKQELAEKVKTQYLE
jgi:hypothetical protein